MAILWDKIKKILKMAVPASLLNIIWKAKKIPLLINVLMIYLRFIPAKRKQERLSWEELDKLQKQYCKPYTPIPPESRKTTARLQINRLLSLLPGEENPVSMLETGAGHGFLSIIATKEFGIKSTAIDLGFDDNPELQEANVPFSVMDVSQMDFDDNTFDCVVSFNAFEHFEHPEKALSEMIRVAKPGGFVYLDFGPIYYSALGLHLYNRINVPYSQYLFDYDMMLDYMEKNNISTYMIPSVNYWKFEQYQQLWQSYFSKVDVIYKRVSKDYRHLRLVRAYPGIFKAQTNKFSDLTNSSIEILFQKK